MSEKSNLYYLKKILEDRREAIIFKLAQESYYHMKGHEVCGSKTLVDWIRIKEFCYEDISTPELVKLYC